MIYSKDFYEKNWKKAVDVNGGVIYQNPKTFETIAFKKNEEKHIGYYKFCNKKVMTEYFNSFKIKYANIDSKWKNIIKTIGMKKAV